MVYFKTELEMSCHFILGAHAVLVKTNDSKVINRSQKFCVHSLTFFIETFAVKKEKLPNLTGIRAVYFMIVHSIV